LTDAVAQSLTRRDELQIVELGTGTGSNIRYLAPRLGGPQRWTAVDRDAELLELMPFRLAEWARGRAYEVFQSDRLTTIRGTAFECRVETRQRDLDRLDAELVTHCDLVTASALLDLVSESWLRTLAALCAEQEVVALFALTYNGRSSCAPREPDDDWIRDLLNAHQHTDKGLGGPAAGPDAADAALRAFAGVGYDVQEADSHWVLGPELAELQRQLIDGWAGAARELVPRQADAIRSWHERRQAHLQAGRSHIVVEHADLAAWPRGSAIPLRPGP
jgi:hypothetical protein